jgi:hypothetical protein
VKFLRQIDVNIREELDAEFGCSDKALTFEGQSEGWPKGCFINWISRDISGWSGNPVSRTGMPDSDPLGDPVYANAGVKHDFDGRPFWPIYKSYEVVDSLEAFRKVRFDLEEMVITDKMSRADIETKISECFTYFIKTGETRPKCEDFRDALKGNGVNVSDVQLGKILKQLDVKKVRLESGRGNVYDLSPFLPEAAADV